MTDFVPTTTTRKTTEELLCYLNGHHCFYFPENLAFGKQTDQISTFKGSDSSRAVDGNSNTNIHVGSLCTHTQRAYQPWWRVDLGREEPVSELYIVNRGDCCGDRLANFEIRVGKSDYTGFNVFFFTIRYDNFIYTRYFHQ